MLNTVCAKADAIKNYAYAIGQIPKHQQTIITMIAENNNRLYRAYRMKEMLRLILKVKNADETDKTLNR